MRYLSVLRVTCWPEKPIKTLGLLVWAVGIELLGALKARKLLILRNSKRKKNRKNAEPRYTRVHGTRFRNSLTGIDAATAASAKT
jgi:hypothetical protein